MALEDRDRNFEKALARHLRSSASPGAHASAHAGSSAEACPDPEILAAYHEHSLSPDELSLWKSHVVSCNNCQFVLAQISATDKIALAAPPPELSFPIDEPASSRKQRSQDSRFIDRERRPSSWRWVLLIPAGAIAAGLVAYISLREPKSVSVPPSSVQIAQNQAPLPLASSPNSAASAPAAPVSSPPNEKVAPPAHAVGALNGAASPNRDAIAKEPVQAQLTQQVPNQRTANVAHGPSANVQQQQQTSQIVAGAPSVGGVAAPRIANKLDSKTPSRIPASAQPAASPAPPPPPPSEPGFVADDSISAPTQKKTLLPPPASSTNAPKQKAANVESIAAPSESVEVSTESQPDTSRANARAMLRASALQNSRVFLAPDGKHQWRIGPAGFLAHSKDRGVNWTAQVSGVTADLQAASAPSSKVCWVVGNSGTILLTTNGGARWMKLLSPVTNDLTAVRATDALHAQISFVSDQHTGQINTYETADGGATWSPLPPK
ncbi:MAG: hypothetical protein WBL56_19395 [Candidatus Acidiferrum sp.]